MLLSRSYGFNNFRKFTPYVKRMCMGMSFFVEFRGGASELRYDEFRDCIETLTDHQTSSKLVFKPAIDDTLSDYPICSLVEFSSSMLLGSNGLDSSTIISTLARRCATLRSISILIGSGDNISDVCFESVENFPKTLGCHINPNQDNKHENSWRFTFRRYGRKGKSGKDYKDKDIFLSKFSPFLAKLNGKVNLTSPKFDFLYLEDCSNYHDITHESGTESPRGTPSAVAIESYNPIQSYLCQIVASGPNIMRDFCVKDRPYIGTTTMDELSSHISANAALIKPGYLVLDPFCGTGSLLVACAVLGANVVGGDIDADSLGLLPKDSPLNLRSKNSKFKRFTTGNRLTQDSEAPMQLNADMVSNFDFYNISERLVGRVAGDARQWLQTPVMSHSLTPTDKIRELEVAEGRSVHSFQQFDAIVTDPPFGRREKAVGITAEAPLGDPGLTIAVLLGIAGTRLRPKGRLVFWFPTDGNVTEKDVIERLMKYKADAGDVAAKLRFVRTRVQKLNDGLWRWLCVFVNEESNEFFF